MIALALTSAGAACRPDARAEGARDASSVAAARPATALSTDAARRMAAQVAAALRAPFPYVASVSPDAKLLLIQYLRNDSAGIRVVRRADGRVLYDEVTAERPSSVTWRPDGGAIAYLVDREGAQQQRVATVDLASGTHRVLATNPTASGALSWADVGTRLAYGDARAGRRIVNVSVADAASPDAPSAPWVAGADRRSAFTWSPDGRQLAAVRTADPGALAISDGPGRERALSVAPYGDVRELDWSPDGRSILFTGRAPDDDFLALAEVDVARGTVRRVAGAGGEIVAPRYLRDGRHVTYHVSIDGEAQLFVADPDGGRARRLLPGDGSATLVGDTPGGDTLFVTRVGRTTMPALYAVDVATGRSRPVEAEGVSVRAAPDENAVRGERVTLVARDSTRVPAYLWRGRRDAGDQAGARQALVWVHGGPAIQKVPTWDPVVQLAARAGFDVILLNYRGSAGYGAAFASARGGDTARVGDVLAARDYAVAQLGVPPGRVVLFGHSYGALLAAKAAACDPRGFGGVVLVSMLRTRDRGRCTGTPERVLAFHGANDAYQSPDAAEREIADLLGEGTLRAPAGGLRVVAHEGHNFGRIASWAEVYGAMLAMLPAPTR